MFGEPVGKKVEKPVDKLDMKVQGRPVKSMFAQDIIKKQKAL